MPACAVCSKPVRRARSGPTLCGARVCRRTWLGADLLAGERRQRKRVHDEAVRIADAINDTISGGLGDASEQAGGPQRMPDRAARLPLAVLPSNDRVTATMPRELRERFLARLAPKIERAMTLEVAPQHAGDRATALDNLLGAACATCRGDCCTGGTDHAHLDVESLARVRAAHGWESAKQVAAAYAAHVPRVHYRHSCVYHGVRGCTLPRDMRADICNRHLCGALAQITRAIAAGTNPPFIAVATSATAPRRAAIIGDDRCEPMPISAPATYPRET